MNDKIVESKEHEEKEMDHMEHMMSRLDMIEKHLGLHKKKPTKEEAMRYRKRS